MDTALLPVGRATAPWLRDRRWDLTWLVGSAVIVPLVMVFVWAGVSNALLNLTVTTIVGGPHLFATYTATYLDPRFRRSHGGSLALITILIPAAVVWMTLADFQILMSLFIFAASIHVLQQNAFIADAYRRRGAKPERPGARWIDYGFIGLSFYPIASSKLVEGTFLLGDTEILIPAFFKTGATVWLVSGAFAVFAGAWIAKTADEARRGVLNGPKTLLIGVTATVAFFVPLAASGARLELAFQAINAWHSFQYLGLVWFVHTVRQERGLTASPFVARLSGTGRAAVWYYGFCFLASATLLLGMLALSKADPFRLPFERYYYMGVLSCLLIHYALDGWLFTVSGFRSARAERVPYAALA